MSIFNISAGHNPDGKTACGAIGLIKESTEARLVTSKVIALLRGQGHTVYDCTCDDGTSILDVLQKIVAKCNTHTVDLDVSIHFNSGANDKSGNGSTTGTEVFVYNKTSTTLNTYAQKIVDSIAKLGFKNRSVKERTDLYFLRNTKAIAVLVECCFVDDKDDINLYNADKMALAIVEGILNKSITTTASTASTSSNTSASFNVGDTIAIQYPNDKYIADGYQSYNGIWQIIEYVLAGGKTGFKISDNGIPMKFVDAVDKNLNKTSNSNNTIIKTGMWFRFNRNFTVKKVATVSGKLMLHLDGDGNASNRFWVIADRCKKA